MLLDPRLRSMASSAHCIRLLYKRSRMFFYAFSFHVESLGIFPEDVGDKFEEMGNPTLLENLRTSAMENQDQLPCDVPNARIKSSRDWNIIYSAELQKLKLSSIGKIAIPSTESSNATHTCHVRAPTSSDLYFILHLTESRFESALHMGTTTMLGRQRPT